MLTTALDRRVMLDRYGSGVPRVLALHGWGRGRQDWAGIVADFDALAPDLPGFGLSPLPPSVWGAREYAEFLLPLLDQMRSPILAGHSFGGRIAVHLATLAPHAVAGVVLSGVPLVRLGNSRKPKVTYRLGRALYRRGLLSAKTMEALRHRYGSENYRRAVGVMRDVLVRAVNESYEPQLAAITVPVAMVWGDQDIEVRPAVAQAATAYLGQTTLELVPDCGHDLTGRLSHQVKARIADMLSGS